MRMKLSKDYLQVEVLKVIEGIPYLGTEILASRSPCKKIETSQFVSAELLHYWHYIN